MDRSNLLVAAAAAALVVSGCPKPSAPCAPNGPAPNSIDAPTTFTPDCSPYIATGTIEVRSTLTISAGVKVLFNPVGRVTVDGGVGQPSGFHIPGISGASIVAQGAADAGIVFDSADPNPIAGDWGGVVIEKGGDSTSTFDWVTFLHAGGATAETPAGIWLGGAAQITNCTFRTINALGIRVVDVKGNAPQRLVAFANNTFANNLPNPIRLSGRFVASIGTKNDFGGNNILVESSIDYPSSGTWAVQNVPYEAVTSIEIAGGTVTLPPTVTLLMDPNTAIDISSGGTLVMQQATLTSTAKTAQAWGGISVAPGGAVNIGQSTIEYGGKTNPQGNPLGQIMFFSPAPSSVASTTFTGGCSAAACPGSCMPSGCGGADAGSCGGGCPTSGCAEGCPSDLSGMSLDCTDDAKVSRANNTFVGHTRCNGMWEFECATALAQCLAQ